MCSPDSHITYGSPSFTCVRIVGGGGEREESGRGAGGRGEGGKGEGGQVCYQDMFCCYGEVPPILDNRGFHVQCVIVHSCVSMYPGPCVHAPSPSCVSTQLAYIN